MDDHATIGGLLFALLTPAVLWKRARPIHLILGGAGLGTSAGMMAHWWRLFSERERVVAIANPKA